MNCKIKKIETYLPEKVLSNDMIAKEFPNWNPEKIEEKLGIKERRIVSEQETALDLALNAGRQAIQNYNIDKIGFLILCTQSPDFFLPTTVSYPQLLF
jgi:3-oxoacyl-[acyl-carrier-protein] synthase-3